MTLWLNLILTVAGEWSLGIAIASVLWNAFLKGRLPAGRPAFRPLSWIVERAELLGLGVLLGIAANSYLLFMASFLGVELGPILSRNIRGLGLTLGAYFVIRGWRRRRAMKSMIAAGDATVTSSPEQSAIAKMGAGIVFVLFLAALGQSVLTPQRLWDERAIFGIKGALLFHERNIDSQDWKHSDFVQGHPRYPLLLSLAEEHIYALIGTADDRWAKIVPPLLFLGLILTFAGVASRHINGGQAWLFATLLATTPVLLSADYGALCTQGDLPVACFHGATVLYLWDALQTRNWRSAIAGGLLSAATIFTKDEGIAFAIVDVALFAILLAFFRNVAKPQVTVPTLAVSQRIFFIVLSFALIPVALLAPWFWHRAQLPTTNEMDYFGRLSWENLRAGMGTLSWSVPHLLRRMFVEAPQWGLQWWLLLAALVTQFRRAGAAHQLFLLGDVMGALIGLLMAGMIAPVAVEDHIGGSSQRFLLQLVPVAVLFAAAQWGRPRGS